MTSKGAFDASIIRVPTGIDVKFPVWKLPEPSNLWGKVAYVISSLFYSVNAGMVYALRYFNWRQTANTIVSLVTEPISSLYTGFCLQKGKVEEDKFHYFDLNPTTLSYEQKKYPAIILLNGKGSNQGVWIELAKTFQKEGIRNVFTVNFPDGELTNKDITVFKERLTKIQTLYGDQKASVIIIGHSKGAEGSLFAALPEGSIFLQDGYCYKIGPWSQFFPEILGMIRLGSPMLPEERKELSPELQSRIYEINANLDLIIPDRSPSSVYQANCGHVGILYDHRVHDQIIQIIRDLKKI